MNASRLTLTRSDGLHILAKAPLSQLAALPEFVDGLLLKTLNRVKSVIDPSLTLAQALHHAGPQTDPLLATLLVLDAEVSGVVDKKRRTFSLPGFLSYRHKLSPDRFSFDTMRLPPINPDGNYRLSLEDDGSCLAVRLDLHPQLKVAGHVRIAASNRTRSPVRLQAAEHRLERKVLSVKLIDVVVAAANEGLHDLLTETEQVRLANLLEELIRD